MAGSFAQASTDLVPVHARHDDVEQDEVRLPLHDGLERLLARSSGHDEVAARREDGVEQLDVLGQVVDHEDRRRPGAFVAGHGGAPADVGARYERTRPGSSRTSMGFSI